MLAISADPERAAIVSFRRRWLRASTDSVVAWTMMGLAVWGCGREAGPGELPTCRLRAVSPPRLLGDENSGIGFDGPLASGATEVGIPWYVVPPPPRDPEFDVLYQVLDRRSGDETRHFEMPHPDRTATGGDDLVVERYPDNVYCTGHSNLDLYEDFDVGSPAGQGYVASNWPDFPTSVAPKWLFVGESMIIEAGEYFEGCIIPNPGWFWYVIHPRDGSGQAFHSIDRGVRGDGPVWGVAESRGHGLILVGSGVGVLDGERVLLSCGGPCLVEIASDGTVLRDENVAEGLFPGPEVMWLVGGVNTVLVGWSEAETPDTSYHVRVLRLPDGEATEVVADYRLDLVPLGFTWTSGDWHWSRAGDGFALLAELNGDRAGQRGIVLLDEAGAVVQQIVVDTLPPYAGSAGLVGGFYYQLASSDDCLDVTWGEWDRRAEGPDGFPEKMWLQSFCCAP
jgi:hypothetical protein